MDAGRYWSSSAVSGSSGFAWSVNFNYGRVTPTIAGLGQAGGTTTVRTFEKRIEAPLARERAKLGIAALLFRPQVARRLWRRTRASSTLVAADVASEFDAKGEELRELLRV
jgi:hypothetical protein